MKTLIKNGLVLMDEDKKFKLKKLDIVVDGDHISKICECGEEGEQDFDKEINAEGKLVMPGLINAHTHAYMTLFRNYADDQEFFDWLNNVQSVEDFMTEEDLYWGTLLAIIEMLKTGTTCFVDMNIRNAKNGKATGPEGCVGAAVADSGIRAYLSRGFVGEVEDEYTKVLMNGFTSEMEIHKENPKVNYLMGPHAPYSCMASNLKMIVDFCKEKGLMQTIHLSESDAEIQNMAKDHDGHTPISYVDSLGVFDVPTIAAHCVKATDDDIKILKEKNVSVAINPKSNMKLGNGFAPADKFLEAGVNVCLGTDGAGSNNSLNMFQEMNTAALVYKGKEQKAKCVDAEDVIRFATENGAKALGLEGKLGIIKEGALADLIIIDLYRPQFFPSCNIISGLVYSATGSEVETVMVGGEILMENGRILTIDVDEVYEQCERIADRLNMLS